MRKLAEGVLRHFSNFISINGTAEQTNLGEVVDMISAGQSFHWFDPVKAHKEFKRILKPNGYVIIIWNNRRKSGTNFSNEYEKIMRRYGTDYKLIRKSETHIEDFYKYRKKLFYNFQKLDYTGLKGRFLSASYIPLDDDPVFNKMISDLKKVFDENQKKGFVMLEYDTEVNYGTLD